MRCDADEVVQRCLIVDDNGGFLAVAQASLEREGLTVALTPADDHRCVKPSRVTKPGACLPARVIRSERVSHRIGVDATDAPVSR